jgi:alpha-galactosidase
MQGPPGNAPYVPDEFSGEWGKHTGDWRVNPKAHPHGLLPISNAAKNAGMKFLLWVEPERAVTGTRWTTQHPDWFLASPADPGNRLLDLGNPAALRGLTSFLTRLIRKNRVALYRQDCNFDLLPYWQHRDAPDRIGISETQHVTGLYRLWDTLRNRFPGLIIDNCASGGRRIDLETLSRSIPLWRSDWQCSPDNDPIGGQTHGMGLSYWVPLHGTGTYNSMSTRARCSTYRARSTMGPAWMLGAFPYGTTPIDPDYPWDWFRQMAADYLRARAAFAGDYYPLAPASPASDIWAAYQMHEPKKNEGFLMAFRRKDAPWTAAAFKLRGLDPRARYEILDADTRKTRRAKGAELLATGLEVRLREPNTSALLFYQRV